jgi:hypothetical protein
MDRNRLCRLAVGYISEAYSVIYIYIERETIPEIVTMSTFWLVDSAKEGNDKMTGRGTYSVFQSVATWLAYVYSLDQYRLVYHIREEAEVIQTIFF